MNIYMYVHIYLFIYIYLYTYIHLCVYIHIHIYVYIYVYTYTLIHIYIYYVYIYTCIYMYVYIYAYMHMYKILCVYVYVHPQNIIRTLPKHYATCVECLFNRSIVPGGSKVTGCTSVRIPNSTPEAQVPRLIHGRAPRAQLLRFSSIRFYWLLLLETVV